MHWFIYWSSFKMYILKDTQNLDTNDSYNVGCHLDCRHLFKILSFFSIVFNTLILFYRSFTKQRLWPDLISSKIFWKVFPIQDLSISIFQMNFLTSIRKFISFLWFILQLIAYFYFYELFGLFRNEKMNILCFCSSKKHCWLSY